MTASAIALVSYRLVKMYKNRLQKGHLYWCVLLETSRDTPGKVTQCSHIPKHNMVKISPAAMIRRLAHAGPSGKSGVALSFS